MFKKWVNILPVFVVRWMALKYGERFEYYYEGRILRTFACGTPGVYFKVTVSNEEYLEASTPKRAQVFYPQGDPKS